MIRDVPEKFGFQATHRDLRTLSIDLAMQDYASISHDFAGEIAAWLETHRL